MQVNCYSGKCFVGGVDFFGLGGSTEVKKILDVEKLVQI